MIRSRQRIVGCVVGLAIALGHRAAWAADPPPITRNDYALELVQGPVQAPGRLTGVAGATTANAQALEGVYNNAAAPAVREANSVDHLEFEPSGGISFPGAYGGTDFNNRGEKGIEQQIERNKRLGLAQKSTVETTDRFLYLNGGLWGQIGNFGATLTADMLRYNVASGAGQSLSVGLTRFHLVGAYSFFHNQLCIGAGARMAYVDINESSADTGVISMFGVGPQVGVIVKPDDQPFRLGFTARGPVLAGPFSLSNLTEQKTEGTTIRRAGTSFILPDRIVLPWEIEAGVAYQLGPRPLNPSWVDPSDYKADREEAIRASRASRAAAQKAEIEAMPNETPAETASRASRLDEIARSEMITRIVEDGELEDLEKRFRAERKARYLNWPREHVLLLASVLLTGPSEHAVALEGFLDQRRELVGKTVSISPRLAVETETVPNLVKTRAGIYFEPSRFVDGTTRQHFTLGFDLRLFEWTVFGIFPKGRQWRITAFLDMAARYQNFGVGIGSWH